jgi:hypothetical protein
MQLSQSYARPSSAQATDNSMEFSLSAQESRPGVQLKARIKNSPDYARAMLALFAVVQGDERFKTRDHTEYQKWVRGEYLRELSPELVKRNAELPIKAARRDELRARIQQLSDEAKPLRVQLNSTSLWGAKGRYWKWLLTRHRELWVILDPVVSVHPDATIFEAFSQDESSYGRVTVLAENLETQGEVVYGTTNVDFSEQLAGEIKRVRSYRPAELSVGAGGVAIATDAGERFEKKIDLPPTWVRGFLQVQSAGTLPSTAFSLSASTVAEILMILNREREQSSPRALKFVLENGHLPQIVVEPWNIVVQEHEHAYSGQTQEVRVWGRRRLKALRDILPHAQSVQVQLLGTGMPSFWSVEANGHRFDLGLSGWTKNDWSSAARFDLLASLSPVTPGDVEVARGQLERALKLSPQELADRSDLGREAATAALQSLCRDGDAMFDALGGFYRWRKLLPPGLEAQSAAKDPKVETATQIVRAGGVKFLPLDPNDHRHDSNGAVERGEIVRLRAQVTTLGRDGTLRGGEKMEVLLDVDRDGRATFASCTCRFFRENKLKKGPCAHILSVAALASSQVTAAREQQAATGALDPNRLKGKSFCFTGTLKLYGREQAETLAEQAGGKAASGVSKNLDYLVAGEKAGSKTVKAALLGVKVLSEDEFKEMLDGKREA